MLKDMTLIVVCVYMEKLGENGVDNKTELRLAAGQELQLQLVSTSK